MNKRVFKNIIVFIMTLSFLSSCATMQEMKPQNSAEREIFIQAIAAAGVIGTAAGAIYGYTKGGKDKSEKDKKESAAKAAAWGGAIGSGIGLLIAKQQLKKLRNIRLKNDQLSALLDSARQYNQEVAGHNERLQKELNWLKKKSKAERKRIAMDKKKQVEKYQAQVKAAIAERKKLSEKLVPEQKEKYQETLGKLEAEDRKLQAAINKLDSWGMGTV